MSDDDQTQPVRPEASTPPPPRPPPAGRRDFGERLRSLRRSEGSRTFGLAALIASALAGVFVGGLCLATAPDDDDSSRS